MSKLKKVLIICISTTVLVVLVVVVYFALGFGYGGPGGFIAELKKPPSNSKLEELRNEAMTELTQAQEKLGAVSKLTLYERTSSDMCAKGEHDWKRNDPYSNICVYRLTYYYGVDINTTYKNVLLELEKKLPDIGWAISLTNPEQPTISEVLSQYPSDQSLLHLPEYRSTYRVGAATLNINRFEGLYSGYDWTTEEEEPEPFGFGVANYQIFYKQHSDQSLREISEKIISQNRKPIMFSISKEYFKN